MDLAYKWLMCLLPVITDMFYNPSTGDDDFSNYHLHIMMASHVLVCAWMCFTMTTQAATTSYIDWSSTNILLVWLHTATRIYMHRQEILPSVVKGFVQCVGWQLQITHGHIRTSLSAHGVNNLCNILVKPNTSSRCEYTGLQMKHQCDPELLLLHSTGVIPSTAMRWKRRMLHHNINTFFIGPC